MSPDKHTEPGSEARCTMAENTASYVRGELDIGEEQAFKKHLGACTTCLALVQDFRGVIGTLAQRPEVSPSRDLTDGILTELPDGAWSDEGPRGKRKSYELTEPGRRYLGELTGSWKELIEHFLDAVGEEES